LANKKEREGELKMKTALTLFSALAVTCALAMPAAAQAINQQELNNFSAFLNSHPNTAAQLQRNPALVDNAAYLDQHPQLHEYLANHDGLRKAIQRHPGRFMYREGRYSYGWEHGWNPAWSHAPSQEEWERYHNWGYTDPDDHRWHDREWWENHRADWVRQHHPNWAAARAEQRENYREWQAHHEHDEDQNQHHDNGKHKGWDKHDGSGHGDNHGHGNGHGHGDNH
jgi:hypothetical protein